jgi:hypothetical protein
MDMDWEALVDELWSYATSNPKELETKIRACLKGHSSEGLLQAISLLIAQGQHATARALLREFLENHQAADDIQRRLELILHVKKYRTTQLLSIKNKQRSKELLIKDVNDLVASGELQGAESLLLEAIDTFEEPDSLNLLSRVYILQRRPIDGAKAMQRALILKRQQQAFVENESEVSVDDLPTDCDLAFLNESAEHLATLETPIAPTDKVLTKTVDLSSIFIHSAASQYPSLNADDWWEGQAKTNPSEASKFLDEPEADVVSDTSPVTINSSEAHMVRDGLAPQPSTKNTLKLSHPRTTTESGEGFGSVKVFNKSSRSFSVIQSASTPELSISDDSLSKPASSLTPEEYVAIPLLQDEILDEDYDDVPQADFELNLPTPVQMGLGLEDPEDDLDFVHDLHDLTIVELGVESEGEFSVVLDDFRDLDDDYAAYAFDPDDVFDSEEKLASESNECLADKLSREDRALQKAAELIGEVNWPLSSLPLVQQIFVMSGWGATRLALEREIEKGLTPEELILAAHIKVIWAGNDIYWIAFDKTGSSRLSYYVLSWPIALLIVRSFESLPQAEEIEFFLENLFASWYENTTLRRSFKAFSRYLWFRFANLEGCLPANQHFDFCDPRDLPAEEYSDLGLCDTLDIEKTSLLRGYGVFQTKHPQEPSCYFSDKPPVIEEESCLNATGKGERARTGPEDKKLRTHDADSERIDDVVDKALPEWSATSLTSALQGQNAGQSSHSIEP